MPSTSYDICFGDKFSSKLIGSGKRTYTATTGTLDNDNKVPKRDNKSGYWITRNGRRMFVQNGRKYSGSNAYRKYQNTNGTGTSKRRRKLKKNEKEKQLLKLKKNQLKKHFN